MNVRPSRLEQLRHREGCADERGHLEPELLLGGQLVDARGEQHLDRRGQLHRRLAVRVLVAARNHRAPRLGQRARAILRLDDAARHERAHELDRVPAM
jgi:hypothetical protein